MKTKANCSASQLIELYQTRFSATVICDNVPENDLVLKIGDGSGI